jgi:vacuolar protein sorting-associated protein IST1
MEILEMFCDLLLARFGLVTQLKELDEGISEAVSSIIWVAPRLQADCAELKVISDMLTAKYGKPYADACRAGVPPANVSEKLQHKMSIQAPPKLLVEKYLIEIAKIFNIDYEPDQSIMKGDENRQDGTFLIDFAGDKNNLDGNIPTPPGPGFAAFPQPPPIPILPHPPQNIPFNYPPGPSYPNSGPYPISYHNSGPSNQGGGGYSHPSAPYNYNIPPNPQPPSLPPSNQQYPSGHPEKKDLNVNFLSVSESFLLKFICALKSSLFSNNICMQKSQEEKRKDLHSMPPPYSSIDSSNTVSPDDNAQVSRTLQTLSSYHANNLTMLFHSLSLSSLLIATLWNC